MDVSSIARRLLHTGALLATFAALAACGGGGAAGTSDLASVASLPRDAAAVSDPGSLGVDFLRSRDFDALTIEVDYPAGRAPSEEAIALLVRRLGEYCRKPGGIVAILDDAIPAEAFGDTLDGDTLRGLERVWRDRYADAATGEAVLYLLCVPGAHAANTATTRVLGLSYGGASCALFLDATDRGADVYATTAETQGTILVHEACHLLGLVNNGIEMVVPHEDPHHVHHCTDATCLMGAAPRVPRLGPNLDDPDFAPLCPHCLADLARAAGN